jgi:rSAM/selenodomain-associated transferase 2
MISVIIPTLNEANSLPLSLAPLQPLRHKLIEIIIVDGGSYDDTLRIAQTLADKIISTDKGRARQMNAGATEASGNILLFLHADVQLPKNAFELIQQYSLPHHWGRFDVQLNSCYWRLKLVSWFMNQRSCLTGITTGDQGFFIQRTLFNSIEGFPDIPLMEDIAISKKLKQYSRPICIKTPIKVSARYWEQHGIWRSIFRMWGIRLAYFFKVPTQYLAKKYYS